MNLVRSPAVDSGTATLSGALEREWYHTIELAPGVETPGWFDTRGVVPELPFPASLAGKRCLDVATFDGFWAFEMERRGAAETVGIDILDPMAWDWPVGSDTAVIEALRRRKQGGEDSRSLVRRSDRRLGAGSSASTTSTRPRSASSTSSTWGAC